MPVWLFGVGLTALVVVALCMFPVGSVVLHLTAHSLRPRVVGVSHPSSNSVCSEVTFCTLSSAADCGADLSFAPFCPLPKWLPPPYDRL